MFMIVTTFASGLWEGRELLGISPRKVPQSYAEGFKVIVLSPSSGLVDSRSWACWIGVMNMVHLRSVNRSVGKTSYKTRTEAGNVGQQKSEGQSLAYCLRVT